jgi:hypothetical protein
LLAKDERAALPGASLESMQRRISAREQQAAAALQGLHFELGTIEDRIWKRLRDVMRRRAREAGGPLATVTKKATSPRRRPASRPREKGA